MTYEKKEFKKTGIFHIIIGVWIILSLILMRYYMNVGQSVNILGFLVATIYIFLGVKVRNASRIFVIAVIILNLLQIINFNFDAFQYVFAFGPHIQLDIINWKISTGTNTGLWIRFGEIYSQSPNYFKISLINLAIVIYLFDQIRFIKSNTGKPWESEFTNS